MKGSVLCPILFVIYINDLPDNLKGHAEMFVDDTKVFSLITLKCLATCGVRGPTRDGPWPTLIPHLY